MKTSLRNHFDRLFGLAENELCCGRPEAAVEYIDYIVNLLRGSHIKRHNLTKTKS